ncbi:PREDICTED: TNF receptor-associated factor 3 [Condylura cristata]|uniref:TNF receptor-associated factor 3 n=1 Tax=Condylura cristata TaxID=143302 RepID=UPI00064387B7|nr:PREDICTED: TNF receptor-associated factor 3 [Condylura cristata]
MLKASAPPPPGAVAASVPAAPKAALVAEGEFSEAGVPRQCPQCQAVSGFRERGAAPLRSAFTACPCKERLLRRDLRQHVDTACKYREATCAHCKSQVPMVTLQKHEDTECPCVVVSCPHKCSVQALLRRELSAHLSECVNAPSTCSFKRYGCVFQVSIQHSSFQSLTFCVIVVLLTCNVPVLDSCLGVSRPPRAVLSVWPVGRGPGGPKHEDTECPCVVVSCPHKCSVQALLRRLLESQLSRHDQMLSVHDIRLADMDLRFQVLETASYNGVLIWKIRDYKRRKQEAVMGKTLSLYSQPFYTGYFGYKMCARVYLNGDGMGKGTHLSLFFVIMRGEYDALLPWPFKQKVTLMLMDQGASRRHLGDAFKPDPNSSSFKKPTGEMNIASGCPVFVAQTVLENGTYIKDDTIFIKVIVDTSDLPDP